MIKAKYYYYCSMAFLLNGFASFGSWLMNSAGKASNAQERLRDQARSEL